MEQEQLFRTAPDAVTVSARWQFQSGWHLVVWSRPNGGPWEPAGMECYDGLDSEELLDVIAVELARRLGLKDG